MNNTFLHIPVLANEVVDGLNIKKDGIYVDGTLGGGGHAALILEKLDKGIFIGIDQDAEALAAAKENLEKYNGKVIFVKDNFVNLEDILKENGFSKVDGILLDLGVSSYQLDNLERGFSFRDSGENLNSKLDMRMDRDQDFSAYDVVNKYNEDRLIQIFFKYGEEPFSRRIAKNIIEARRAKSLETVGELLEVIKRAMPPKYRFSKKAGNWASKIFRAIRMEVNDELHVIEEVIPQAVDCLNSGGRLAIITFHSLEDRIVKHMFRDMASGDHPKVKLITKKPVLPAESEIDVNRRSESAKLRIVEAI